MTLSKCVFAVFMVAVSALLTPASAIDADDFDNVLGYYVVDSEGIRFLYWRTSYGDPGSIKRQVIERRDKAKLIDRDARFYTYGMDFASSVVPPHFVLSACIARPDGDMDGIYPIRAKFVSDGPLPLYELLFPDSITGLAAEDGRSTYLFWTLGIGQTCIKGWPFRFR